jgi:phospholipid/cholesterol/gamma-HCH transport system permease protein
MSPAAATVERQGRTAVVHLRGDLAIASARQLHGLLRAVSRRRDVRKVVLDFREVERLDSAGVAVIELTRRALQRSGKQLELDALGDRQRAALELAPQASEKPAAAPDDPPWLEVVGDRLLAMVDSARGVVRLVAEVIHQTGRVLTRRRRLPAGSVSSHILTMGADGVFIVGLLSFLLGVTTAFQGIMQLTRFGAGVFVADMVGWSMIRELAPLMTAVVLTGRTGAAIAAELGAMRVGQEIDALTAMGVSPVRFLVLPRLAALTIAVPALTLIAMFVGICGGMLVAALLLEMAPSVFFMRIVARVDMADFLQGFSKSFVFAWIIGLTASHLGMRASGDATSVGSATTRTVVVSIFFIIVVDALFATAITLWGHP